MASKYDKHEAGYDSLATAIVIQAVRNYKIARKHNDMFEVNAIRKFFLSDWCKMLCNILLHRLDPEKAKNPNEWTVDKPIIVNLAKQRDGETGEFVAAFNQRRLNFYEKA